MDLAALKNINLKDLFSKFTGGGGILGDKKLLVKFGIGFGSIIIFLIIYYAFVSPKVNDRKARIDVMNENQNKINEYLANIGTLEASVKKLEPKYKKSSKLFHSRKEVEDLYQNISNFAMTNGLVIINIQKGEPTVVNNPAAENQEGSQALYYKIPVNYKIQGGYLGYLKFRRALSKSSKVINFDKEIITVEANNTSGMILSEGTISIVGLPDEYKK